MNPIFVKEVTAHLSYWDTSLARLAPYTGVVTEKGLAGLSVYCMLCCSVHKRGKNKSLDDLFRRTNLFLDGR